MRTKFSEEVEALIVERYVAGTSANLLASLHKCCTQTVVNILDRRGLRRSTRTWKREDLVKYSQAQIDEAVRRIRDGERVTAVARSMGVDQRMVSKWWMASGGKPTRAKNRRVDKSGYVFVGCPDEFAPMRSKSGYVMEHRLVMAQHLGRPLQAIETVHHISGDRSDNRIENLQLRHGKHGKNERFRCACCGSFNIEAVEID